MSRAAHRVESVRLAMADELLDHVDDMLADRRATPEQLRCVVARLAEALPGVHRLSAAGPRG
ncbi:hypothetical protein ABZ070_23000 [Streptomyces sp. NPDC006283]|uniref:hypothetical protein n=1 Tax=Streptomyces sp. NPDC006283 TaxID=3156741 RepID=UPI0033B662B4